MYSTPIVDFGTTSLWNNYLIILDLTHTIRSGKCYCALSGVLTIKELSASESYTGGQCLYSSYCEGSLWKEVSSKMISVILDSMVLTFFPFLLQIWLSIILSCRLKLPQHKMLKALWREFTKVRLKLSGWSVTPNSLIYPSTRMRIIRDRTGISTWRLSELWTIQDNLSTKCWVFIFSDIPLHMEMKTCTRVVALNGTDLYSRWRREWSIYHSFVKLPI